MSKARKPTGKAAALTFENLVLSIHGVDRDLAAQAGRAINLSLTLRNWLIGCYISEYELRGADRTGPNTVKSYWRNWLSGSLKMASAGPRSVSFGAIGSSIRPTPRFGRR
jgi:hypothetical protein